MSPSSSAWVYARVVAHRGGGACAPENTLAAMRCGLAHGFRAVEFDVMLARDAVPVVVHDPVLGRTVKGFGSIPDYSASELAALDAGSWFGPDYAGEPVPGYREVFDYCQANHIWMNVEIKPAPGCAEATGRRVAQLTRAWLAAQPGATPPLFSSFSFDALAAARDAAPEIARGFLLDRIGPDWREQLEALGAIALHTNHKHLTQDQARAVKDAGYGLFCYTVNDRARGRELFSWGVDAFCTDRIDLIGPDFS
jgi:glycerophosphoryl diester phosphodiesterase